MRITQVLFSSRRGLHRVRHFYSSVQPYDSVERVTTLVNKQVRQSQGISKVGKKSKQGLVYQICIDPFISWVSGVHRPASISHSVSSRPMV